MAGKLYIVSTPIGNLEDITYRAVNTLKEVDLVAAEDTRRTRKLLNAYRITKKVISYHSYSGRKKEQWIISELCGGKQVALVSDSGTPGLSDPGEKLIKECIEKNIEVTTIPGPSACIAALVASGKPTNSFVFEGFLSNKSAKRKKQLERLLKEDRTVVLYESPHRIIKFLEDVHVLDSGREVVVARELTKKFEEIRRGSAAELISAYSEGKPKGEITVIL